MKTTLRTRYGNIVVQHLSPGAGTIESDFRGTRVEGSCYDAAMDTLESIVLAHALLDLDVQGQDYVNGINTALDAIINNVEED